METFCPYFNARKCQSCEWIDQPYASQIHQKETHLRALLSPIFSGKSVLEPTLTSAPKAFRNRAKLSVTGTLSAPIIGLTGGADDLDAGQELLACPIHHPKLNTMIQAMPHFIREARLEPYRISERAGELKGLILYYSPESNEMYLRFILRSQECVARLTKFLPSIRAQFPELTCVTANIQPVPHAILEGELEIYLTEQKTIAHVIEGVALRLAPRAFVQTHFSAAEKLYRTAAEWISETGAKRMVELYCGQGAFSFVAASKLEKSLGIEINPEAVETARATAKTLGLSHLEFLAMDAQSVAREAIAFTPDLVLVNPPRKGLQKGVELVRTIHPRWFIYSSCSAESLAEDLKKLVTHYIPVRCQIFDFFPHTSHFETLILLKRRD